MQRRVLLFVLLVGASIAIPLAIMAEYVPDFNHDGEN